MALDDDIGRDSQLAVPRNGKSKARVATHSAHAQQDEDTRKPAINMPPHVDCGKCLAHQMNG
jgi:hypothetical protein